MSQARIVTGRDRGAVPDESAPQRIVGACGNKINPRALDRHMATCGQCLTWWVNNSPRKRGNN